MNNLQSKISHTIDDMSLCTLNTCGVLDERSHTAGQGQVVDLLLLTDARQNLDPTAVL